MAADAPVTEDYSSDDESKAESGEEGYDTEQESEDDENDEKFGGFVDGLTSNEPIEHGTILKSNDGHLRSLSRPDIETFTKDKINKSS